ASVIHSEDLAAPAAVATATRWRNQRALRVHEGSMPALLLLALVTASVPADLPLARAREWWARVRRRSPATTRRPTARAHVGPTAPASPTGGWTTGRASPSGAATRRPGTRSRSER